MRRTVSSHNPILPTLLERAMDVQDPTVLIEFGRERYGLDNPSRNQRLRTGIGHKQYIHK